MSDTKVDIKESSSPTHSVDVEQVVNDLGQTVVRQKTLDPEAVKVLADVRRLLGILVGIAPAREPATSASRVAVQGTVPVSGSLTAVTTVTTVTTTATLTNQVNLGGLPAQNEQYGHGAAASAALVQRSIRWI